MAPAGAAGGVGAAPCVSAILVDCDYRVAADGAGDRGRPRRRGRGECCRIATVCVVGDGADGAERGVKGDDSARSGETISVGILSLNRDGRLRCTIRHERRRVGRDGRPRRTSRSSDNRIGRTTSESGLIRRSGNADRVRTRASLGSLPYCQRLPRHETVPEVPTTTGDVIVTLPVPP